jgi:starvation-inducible DNA-binding protein
MNRIGLDEKMATEIAEKLNVLLANYQVFYVNLRGLHWNIKGEKFFELHLKFEELYNDAFLRIDEIAERILTLGHTPKHSFSDYLKTSNIPEKENITNPSQGVELVLTALKQLLFIEREVLRLTEKAGDEGTNALMSDYIRLQEKWVWMYSAFVANA